MGTSQSGLKTKKTKRMETDVLAYERIGHVTDIIIYPVKSCKGISLKSANCLTEGLQSDRFVREKSVSRESFEMIL